MIKTTDLRSPVQVMRLARLGAAFPTRLSFMRVLLRLLAAENAVVSRPVWQIDGQGFGRAVYAVDLGGFTYSLVAFATPLADQDRSDRVIAEAWDATFVLFDGVPDAADLDRLAANAPLQEAGRFTARELVLCRANKSMRMFGHVVESLSQGRQPSRQMMKDVGYLMRTTAVYGNGKFGIADRAVIADRPGLSGPFFAEMLAVWLVRGFTQDLVEHVAKAHTPDRFVPLADDVKRHLGIGNATGLGMAPFLVSHPALLNNWIWAREAALARVLALPKIENHPRLLNLIARARRHLTQWQTDDARQMQRIKTLRWEWDKIAQLVTKSWLKHVGQWPELQALSKDYSVECQELMVALMLEANGDMVDDLAVNMASRSRGKFSPEMSIDQMLALLRNRFAWALEIDFADGKQQQQFWYVSAEKNEPRLGNRYAEAGVELEMPLDIARQVQALAGDLKSAAEETLGAFLRRFPQYRYVARRMQVAQENPYSEIHDNLIADTCLPIDMLRCKLAFFGAAKFDPKSDRWTRINMYQGAPVFTDIGRGNSDDWWLPVLEDVSCD